MGWIEAHLLVEDNEYEYQKYYKVEGGICFKEKDIVGIRKEQNNGYIKINDKSEAKVYPYHLTLKDDKKYVCIGFKYFISQRNLSEVDEISSAMVRRRNSSEGNIPRIAKCNAFIEKL